jgi:hypothetical protein
MKPIFKITAISPNDPPVIGDSNFPEHYTGANANMAWSEIEPGIRQATEKFILPYLGQEMYDALADYFETLPGSPDPNLARALALLQDCAAYYTAYHVLPERNSFLASMGVVQNNPTGGSAPVPQWAYKEKRWNALANADSFLDLLLAHLEKMVADGEAAFDPWKNSSAYKVTGSVFFRQTKDLDAYLNMQGSRRTFLSLIKYLRDVEDEVITPILCSGLIAELKTQLADGALSTANATLMKYVWKAVANLGLVAAVPHHRITIDGDGFRVVSQTDQFDDRRNQTNSIHENAIMNLMQAARDRGTKAIVDLQTFLADNAETYPLWKNSSCNIGKMALAHSLIVPRDGIGGVGVF